MSQEVNLDATPRVLRFADLVALLGEKEAKRLAAGVKAQKAARRAAPTLTTDERAAFWRIIDRSPLTTAEAREVYPLAGRAARKFYTIRGGPSRRRVVAVETWLRQQDAQVPDNAVEQPRQQKRTRKAITDPTVLEKRAAALAKARAARQAKLDGRRQPEPVGAASS